MTAQLDTPIPSAEPPRDGRPARYNSAMIAATAVAVIVLLGLGAYLISRTGSGDSGFSLDDATTTASTVDAGTSTVPPSASSTVSAAPAASSTTSPATTAPATTVTTSASQTTNPPAGQSLPGLIWPAPGAVGFDSPVAAARSFAVDFAGFADPVIGDFSDELDGMVEVRPTANGPVTIVLVRQDQADDSWKVIGAQTPDIQLDSPAERATIADALHLVGRASAFEGQVTVALYIDGNDVPVVDGFVTGRGDGTLGAFDKTFDLPAGLTGDAVLVLTSPSAKDGSAVAVAAIALTIG